MEKNLGHATAYGYAKSKGYSGTEDEFAELMADYASVGQSAAQSAEQAAASATSASGSAATATQAAQTATSKASEAVTAADTATTKASEASASADTASNAATSASTSAQTATTAAATATTKASEAAESATTATTAKTDAETARDAAAQSASEAAESARTLTIDATLTQSGQAADSKVVGDKIEEVKEDLSGLADIVPSPNLLDVDAVTNGYLRDTGAVTVSGDWVTTDYIPVEKDKTYTQSITYENKRTKASLFFRAEYDISKTMIPGTYASTNVTEITPTASDVKYVRYSYHNTSSTERCFAEGAGLSYYEYGKKSYTIDEDAFPANVKNDLLVINAVRTRNLFNKEAVIDGYISNNSGAISISGDWVTSDYIPVEYGKQYTCSTDAANPSGTFYMLEVDEDKKPVTYQSKSPRFPYSPSSASVKYIRFSIHSPALSSLVYEESTQAKSIYTPYGYYLNAPYKGLLYGKKWVAVGDSLTEKNVSAISNYTDFISVLNNMKIVNKGLGGTGYMRGYDQGYAFYQRAANIPDCDIITLFGSGNDLAYYSDLGTATDTTTDTICGCINETLDVIFANHPTTPLLVIAPTPWAGNTPDMTTGMALYCERLKEICSMRGVAYLDLFHHSGLRPDDTAQRDLVFYNGSLDGHGDYVHPNKLGHSIIAPKIMKAMESVCIF